MSDVPPQIPPPLKAPQLPGLQLDADFIHPDYQGGSILNLPSTICRNLGAESLGAAPLRPELTVAPPTNLRRIILILVDALSLHRLQRWMTDGTAPVWARLAETGKLSALTSICPSTTTAALTSLWTGRSPAAHGIARYELWLKEYG